MNPHSLPAGPQSTPPIPAETPASGGAPLPRGSEAMEITFYGVRGSLSSPETGDEIQRQIAAALARASATGARFANEEEALAWLAAHVPFAERSGYGGDTTCFGIRCGEQDLAVDAGTGIRRYGIDLMRRLQPDSTLVLPLLLTHGHYDHTIGLPFFLPLYQSAKRHELNLTIYGLPRWLVELDHVLNLTLSEPRYAPFSVEDDEGRPFTYFPVPDGPGVWSATLGAVRVSARRVRHPIPTLGWRIEWEGRVVAILTDHEPGDPDFDRALLDFARGADLLYLDSQFTRAQYLGEEDGVSRKGWGHGYVEWCADFARAVDPIVCVLGHHNPGAGRHRIATIEALGRERFPRSIAAYDGMQVAIERGAVTFSGEPCGATVRFTR